VDADLIFLSFFGVRLIPAPLRSPRQIQRSQLARLRDQIPIRTPIDINQVTISKTSRYQKDARALNQEINKLQATVRLTRHAVQALVKGRHARIGGRTIPIRAKNLIKIASAYSWDELLEEPGIGPATAAEIELWLKKRGSALREEDSRLWSAHGERQINTYCGTYRSYPDRKSP
jgi:hypothetical protein